MSKELVHCSILTKHFRILTQIVFPTYRMHSTETTALHTTKDVWRCKCAGTRLDSLQNYAGVVANNL